MRRLTHLLAALVLATGLLTLPSASPARAAGHDPVIFVHGYWGDFWNWGVMVDRFRYDGWSSAELYPWDYNTGQSNVTTANQLSAYVDKVLAATGASKVDIVSHSMGGLSTRYYLRNLGGAAKVDEWVSVGGPNHGTAAAYLCFDVSCGDMRFGSPFLTALNSGDETPGAVRYGTFWSSCDEIINPDDSTVLSGASNHHLWGCIGHVSLLGSLEVYLGVRDFIR